MTAIEEAVRDVIVGGSFALFAVIWIIFKVFGQRRGYLAAIDLAAHVLAGASILAVVWTGLGLFAEKYPVLMRERGQTNDRHPYKPYYDAISKLRETRCVDGENIDCLEIKRFFRNSYAEVNGDYYRIRYEAAVSPQASEELRTLIKQYTRSFDMRPRPIDTIREVLGNLKLWIVVPGVFAWFLGIHRRYISLMQALASPKQPPNGDKKAPRQPANSTRKIPRPLRNQRRVGKAR